MLNIHQHIIDKLKYFYGIHKIPNIIFHGQSGSGKRTIVSEFINIIYNDDLGTLHIYFLLQIIQTTWIWRVWIFIKIIKY